MQEGIIQTRGKALLIEELDQEDETDQELPCEQGVVELGRSEERRVGKECQ